MTGEDGEDVQDPAPGLCEWCGRPVRQGATGRRRRYCRRSCRQRAYEARKQREAVVAAVAAVVARGTVSSRDARVPGTVSSRDPGGSAGQRPARVDVGEHQAQAGTPAPVPSRARPDRRRSGMTAQALPLPVDVDQPQPPMRPWPGTAGSGPEPCPYCRRPVVALVEHMRRCAERPDAGLPSTS